MARPKPNPDEVLPFILDKAIRLIKVQGFDSMTMKRLADDAGMSVGKLYHFFPSKDALFLRLEIHYFDELYKSIEPKNAAGIAETDSPTVVFRRMLHDYYAFAVEHLEMYQLVTSPPKVFAHYLGTKNEPLARQELISALRAIALFREYYERALEEKHKATLSDSVDELFMLFVNSVHGLILMSQSTAWPYIAKGELAVSSQTLEHRVPESAPVVDVWRQIDLLIEKLL